MRRSKTSIALAALLICGCGPGEHFGHSRQYVAYTAPRNVILDIDAVYENEDFHEYDANVLSSDFVFRFQQADIQAGQPDSLIRLYEVNFAENLFAKGT